MNAKPSFLGYRGYPGAMCISINDEVIHGIPGRRVVLPGDVVSLDVGVYYNGFHGTAPRP
jgi:methionyl aminopeptidase